MIKNVSKSAVKIKWDSKSKILQPEESYDIREMNVPNDLVGLVENRIVNKFNGEEVVLDIVTTPKGLSEADLIKREADLKEREKRVAAQEAGIGKESKAAEDDIPASAAPVKKVSKK